jgi:hypothetical protein
MRTLTLDDDISICKTNILLHFPGVRQIEMVKEELYTSSSRRRRKNSKWMRENFKRKYVMPYVDSSSPSK